MTHLCAERNILARMVLKDHYRPHHRGRAVCHYVSSWSTQTAKLLCSASSVLGLQEHTTTWDLFHIDVRDQIQVFTSSLLMAPSPQLMSSVLITNPMTFPLGSERSQPHGWLNCVFYQTVGPSCHVAFSN